MKEETNRSFLLFNKKEEKEKTFNVYYDLQYFVNRDSENKICFDCGGPFPTYVSINNGVFICSNCAKNHQKLGYNISFIHQICSPWDPYLLSYALRGGNSRFKRLCLQYEVPCQSFNENDEEKLNKYIIRLGEYNRLVLRSEVLAEEPPKSLYHEVAKQPCNLNIIYFPEFQNYNLYKGEIILPEQNYSMGKKIWNGAKATAGAVGTAGGFVYKVGKPVVCFVGGTAYKGVKYMGNSIWNHYKGSNNNIKENNNSFRKNNNVNNNINYNNNSNGNHILEDFALVDHSDEDLCQIKTIDLSSPKNNERMNINYNVNINNNINSNKYNIFSIDNNSNKNGNFIQNGRFNNQMGNLNKHNNIIVNDNYLINNHNDNDFENINKETFHPSNNVNYINLNNKSNYNGFEILTSPNQDKDYNNNNSNSFFENNSFAGMNVQFENTDKEKARQDANNLLLKP